MRLEKLKQSLDALSSALPPRIELGMPWPHDQGYDDCDSPVLVFEAAQELGGQALLTGEAGHVETFLDLSRHIAEPRVIGFWLRYSAFYADDGGAGLQSLVRSWNSSSDPLKRYLAGHVDHLVEVGP